MSQHNYTIKAVLHLFSFTVLVLLNLCGSSLAAQSMKFTPDQVLVSFLPGTPGHVIAAAHASVGGKVQKSIDGIGVHVVEVPHGTVLRQVAAYQKNPNVKYAQPNYIRPLITPTEGSFASDIAVFDEQWNLHNFGQALQTYTDPNTGALVWPEIRAGADIDMESAWDVTQGSQYVQVAVLDSGVDCNHPDLDTKCANNEDYVSITTNSFGEAIPELTDVIGHGTHVAGIIGMETDNEGGGAGIGWATRLGSFKVCYAETYLGFLFGSNCLDSDIAAAINRVTDLGTYHVMNMSFGGGPSSVIESAIALAFESGIVPVAAAGNNGTWHRVYPAAYPNVVSVGSVSPVDDRSSFSTFSTVEDSWVDLLAPGDPIISTVPSINCGTYDSDCFQWKQGTSMAAPHVSGVAALVWDQVLANDPSNNNKLANRDEVIRRLRDCADHTGAMGQNMLAWSHYGRLNAFGAVTCEGSCTDVVEICNDGVDNNCDGNIDEGCSTCPDCDGDSYVDALYGGNDCDDTDPSIHPGAIEVCDDGVDNNCDDKIDAADPDCDLPCSTYDNDRKACISAGCIYNNRDKSCTL